MYDELRTIAGFTNYKISIDGRVFGTRSGIWIKPNLSDTGYLRVSLYGPHGFKTRFIHKLVAAAWVGPHQDDMVVNHKDGNKLNNHASNLEWATHSENSQHARDAGLVTYKVGGEVHNAKLNWDSVMWIRSCGLEVKLMARILRVDQKTIRNVLQKKTWKHVT